MGCGRQIISIKKLLLIDGHSIAYRAFFAVPRLTTISGQPTNALYGFMNMFLSILQKETPDFVCVAFDLPSPTHRHLMYPEYKANREKSPEEFRGQLPIIKEVLTALGVQILEKEGFEADDVLGTLAKMSKELLPNTLSYILTGDRDVLQLVDNRTQIIITKKGISDLLVLDAQGVYKEYSLRPDQIVDYKALRGDPSDNIPGVSGIGEKTALQLITQFDNLDNIYSNIEKVTPIRIREKLIIEKDLAYLSKKLATIHTDVPMNFKFIEHKLELNNISDVLEKYELHNIVKKFGLTHNISEAVKKNIVTAILVNNDQKWVELQNELTNSNLCAIYFELSKANNIVGLSFSLTRGKAYYLPINHYQDNYIINNSSLGPMFSEQISVFEKLRDFLESTTMEKICLDVKYIKNVFLKEGIHINGFKHDLTIFDYLLRPSGASRSIEKMVRNYLGDDLLPLKEFLVQQKVNSLESVQPIQANCHLAARAEAMYRLNEHLLLKINEMELATVYKTIDYPLVEVLFYMEKEGIKIDVQYLKQLAKFFKNKISDLVSNIFLLAGEKFNINSPKQLGNILFNKLSLPTQKQVKTGNSTDVDVLEKLAPDYEIAQYLLEYRQIAKLLNTYIEVLPGMVDEEDRIHTTFNITVAATGRLSSTDPNLQNIPIKTEYGEKIRRAFIAKEGYALVVADYSQIELRILAHMSNASKMIDAFMQDADIHTATAAEIFGVSNIEITAQMRRKAKEINFGIAYGMKAFGLSQRLKIGQKEAAEYINIYFEKYPEIKRYMDESINFVIKNGYISTMFGRKRFFENYNNVGKMEQQGLNRMIINTPIQGTAADIIKLAMLKLNSELKNYKSKLVLQIHDELIVEAKEEEVGEVKKILQRVMENVVILKVPLTVNIGVGINWLEAK